MGVKLGSYASSTPKEACHSNLSQLVTVAAGSISWGRSDLFQSRGLARRAAEGNLR